MITGVLGGVLVQEQDVVTEHPESWTVVTQVQPDMEQWEAAKICMERILGQYVLL